MTIEYNEIKRAIGRSQHCQRNWDLSRKIPQEDLDLFIEAVTECPSKQNIAFYNAHFVTNREIIERVHDFTDGFTASYDPPVTTTNTQVLANLLVVFEEAELCTEKRSDHVRNQQTKAYVESGGDPSEETAALLDRDKCMAVGVAAGYLNLAGSLLGYSTGCCACFDPAGVKAVLNLERNPLLLMGIGFKNPNLSRRIHHVNQTFLFPTKLKQPIKIKIID